MKVSADQLTDTEKDLIGIYGEQRILKVFWCFENDLEYKKMKEAQVENQKMEQNGGGPVSGMKFVKQASINTKLVVDQVVQLKKASSD